MSCSRMGDHDSLWVPSCPRGIDDIGWRRKADGSMGAWGSIYVLLLDAVRTPFATITTITALTAVAIAVTVSQQIIHEHRVWIELIKLLWRDNDTRFDVVNDEFISLDRSSWVQNNICGPCRKNAKDAGNQFDWWLDAYWNNGCWLHLKCNSNSITQ